MKTVVSTDAPARLEQPVTSSELRARWAEVVSLYHATRIFSDGQEEFWHLQVLGLLQEDVQWTFPFIPSQHTAGSWTATPAPPKYCLNFRMTTGTTYTIVTNQVSGDKTCPLGNRPVHYARYLRRVFLLLQGKKCLQLTQTFPIPTTTHLSFDFCSFFSLFFLATEKLYSTINTVKLK